MSVDDALRELRLTRPVTLHGVKKAYRKLAFIHHPDLQGHAADDAFVRINNAYQLLNSKTEAEINNQYSFTIRSIKRGPVIIPESLIFADIENLFYIFHALNKLPILRVIFKLLAQLFFLPKDAPAILKIMQIVAGFFFAIILFPMLLGTFILLTIPYLLYETFYEWMRKIYQTKTGIKPTKYSSDSSTRLFYQCVRLLPALLIMGTVSAVMIYSAKIFPHIIVYIFACSILMVLSIWLLSILRDITISLNRRA